MIVLVFGVHPCQPYGYGGHHTDPIMNCLENVSSCTVHRLDYKRRARVRQQGHAKHRTSTWPSMARATMVVINRPSNGSINTFANSMSIYAKLEQDDRDFAQRSSVIGQMGKQSIINHCCIPFTLAEHFRFTHPSIHPLGRSIDFAASRIGLYSRCSTMRNMLMNRWIGMDGWMEVISLSRALSDHCFKPPTHSIVYWEHTNPN